MHLGSKSLLSAICLAGIQLFAQSEVGTTGVNGTIIAGAKITATNAGTNFTRQTTSTAAGLYSLGNLPVGAYDLKVEMAGFKTAEQKSLNLAVGSVATVNLQLEIGTSSETVSVTGEAPLVETSRSSTTTAISSRQVQDLPINGRNFLDFTLLTPGVVRDPT